MTSAGETAAAFNIWTKPYLFHLLRMRSNDGNNTQIGTSDKRVFILLNGPPSGYEATGKFLKAALVWELLIISTFLEPLLQNLWIKFYHHVT